MQFLCSEKYLGTDFEENKALKLVSQIFLTELTKCAHEYFLK